MAVSRGFEPLVPFGHFSLAGRRLKPDSANSPVDQTTSRHELIDRSAQKRDISDEMRSIMVKNRYHPSRGLSNLFGHFSVICSRGSEARQVLLQELPDVPQPGGDGDVVEARVDAVEDANDLALAVEDG